MDGNRLWHGSRTLVPALIEGLPLVIFSSYHWKALSYVCAISPIV